MKNEPWQRNFPIGAEVQSNGGVHFRLWAPRRQHVEVVWVESPQVTLQLKQSAISVFKSETKNVGSSHLQSFDLTSESNGYFSGYLADAKVDLRYYFRLDHGEKLFPDPASRYQPDGPAGPSQVVDPHNYRWQDTDWQGVTLPGQIIYELHIGTFTPEGTWRAALKHLPYLKELGITLVEVMPVAEFGGKFGWGYDGVDLFAPTHLYGSPDDFRYFIDQAHASGLGVALDVVYNHLGPAHNYLEEYASEYFTTRYKNEWGKSINFDGPESGPVREFFISNAVYWITEYHLDGLRLDATQVIYDNSHPHILSELRAMVKAATKRSTLIIAENERQDPLHLEASNTGGYELDAVWNDDFHHCTQIAATGKRESYYQDYYGTPQELISAIRHGYLYQGQYYACQNKRRGKLNLHIAPEHFVIYLQNHDQISNTAYGQRLHELTDHGRYRALTVLLLLAPGTPLIFQGQEYAASTPFVFFADHEPELAKLVSKGRNEFLHQFPSINHSEPPAPFFEPDDPATFNLCKIKWAEAEEGIHAQILAFHRDLLSLRREDPAFSVQRSDGVEGAVLGPEAFVLRFFSPTGEPDKDRLLIVNLGRWLDYSSLAEPLLAAPAGYSWQVLLSSESPRYGGAGFVPPEQRTSWSLQNHAATVLVPVKNE